MKRFEAKKKKVHNLLIIFIHFGAVVNRYSEIIRQKSFCMVTTGDDNILLGGWGKR